MLCCAVRVQRMDRVVRIKQCAVACVKAAVCIQARDAVAQRDTGKIADDDDAPVGLHTEIAHRAVERGRDKTRVPSAVRIQTPQMNFAPP